MTKVLSLVFVKNMKCVISLFLLVSVHVTMAEAPVEKKPYEVLEQENLALKALIAKKDKEIAIVRDVIAHAPLHQEDPDDILFQAWLETKRAEKLEQEGKYNDSLQKYKQATQYYSALSEYHKEWKPNLVKSRMTSAEESMQRIQTKVAEELASNKLKTQDLIEQDRKNLIARKDKEIAMIRDVLARAPLQQDMDAISRKNQTLEKEIEITARALKSSKQELALAQSILCEECKDKYTKQLDKLPKPAYFGTRGFPSTRSIEEIKRATGITKDTKDTKDTKNTKNTKNTKDTKNALTLEDKLRMLDEKNRLLQERLSQQK